jgi:hypothetical protein
MFQRSEALTRGIEDHRELTARLNARFDLAAEPVAACTGRGILAKAETLREQCMALTNFENPESEADDPFRF